MNATPETLSDTARRVWESLISLTEFDGVKVFGTGEELATSCASSVSDFESAVAEMVSIGIVTATQDQDHVWTISKARP